MTGVIDTAAKRARLTARRNPYWQGVGGGRGGISLGYRKISRGAGAWVAKIVLDGKRAEERIGTADDIGAARDAMSFPSAVAAALAWGRQQYEAIEAARGADALAKTPTIRSSVVQYIAARKLRSARTGANASSRLSRHVLSDQKFADLRLSRLRATDLDAWRARLSPTLAPSTINRLLNDLRAALNSAAEKHRRELPASVSGEVKIGTKRGDAQPNARRQLLSDKQVREVVRGAFAVDSDGDFGRLVMLAAATGARYSQLAALKVADVQKDRLRVMVPASKKGRGRRVRAPVAVPVDRSVIDSLLPALRGRQLGEPLLLRWAYRKVSSFKWEKSKRRPLGEAYEIEKQWAAALAEAGLPSDTIMYALRHSSIVRALRESLPVRLVAALHDTSVEMIEAHYSAYIVDMTEELSRRSVLSLGSQPMLEAAE